MEVQALHKFDNARFPVCDINYASILGISAVDLRDQMIKVGVPWRMQARWHNCMHYCKQINCSFSHALKEVNLVADTLAKNGQSLALYSSQWWDHPLPL
ncbi:hypothetical protein MTR_6g023250 [Medicago truncatula]|uniref:RNase H type-1 domain-containing protein n=1 Tax=Medicago truncatula TaxID=3880 RepID=G7KN95_MEDTR|nr:hypothetical protein MTR_6g023250 [Medicago truncatula]